MFHTWSAMFSNIFNNYPQIFPLVCSLLIFIFLFIHTNRTRVLPVDWPLIGMLPAITANADRLHDYSAAVLRQSGGTFMFKGPPSFGMKYLITGDPANANHMLNLHFTNYPKGTDFLEIFDILGAGIFNSDGDWWRVQRRAAHALLTDRRLRSFVIECSEDKVEKSLVPLLHEMARLDKVFDLQDVLMRYTFDTTCTLLVGVDPGCLSIDFPHVPLAEAIDDAEHVTSYRYTVPKFWWKMLRWLNLGQERRLARAWEIIDCSLAKIIENRREKMKTRSDEEPADLLASYVNYPMQNGEGTFRTDKFLRDTMLTYLAAGRTTTGAALTWFFWLVAKNPNVEAKLQQELKEAQFDSKEMGKLVYLHASLCEALRLYPPVPINHKEVVKPDVLPSGHRVDCQTTILITMYAMGRMESVWGKDCMEFKPERWISEEGKVRHEPSYKFIAFNSGPKSCLGKDMAFAQMKVVATAVFSKFRVEVVEEQVVEPTISVVLTAQNGIMVKVKNRNGDGDLK